MESTVLTLQLSPKSIVAEDAVRKSGATPKTIMRLMNTELVVKLYDYLVTKWKLADIATSELVLFTRGSKMMLTNKLGDYQESEVCIRLAVEYDLVPIADEAATASSTPTGFLSPIPVEPIPEPIKITAPPPVTISDRKQNGKRTSDRKVPMAPLTVSDKKLSAKSTSIETEEAKRRRKNPISDRPELVDACIGTDPMELRLKADDPPRKTNENRCESPSDTISRYEALYEKMFDRYESMVMKVLEVCSISNQG